MLVEVTVCGRKIKMPPPVYIIPETIQVSEETSTVRGKCIFPSSDPSIGAREDHANICHGMFTVWNCAYVLSDRKGWGRLIVVEAHQRAKGIMPPDTEIDFVASVIKVHEHNKRVTGSAWAEFRFKEKILLTVHVYEFINEEALHLLR